MAAKGSEVRVRMPIRGSGSASSPYLPKYDCPSRRNEHYHFDSNGVPVYVEVSVSRKDAESVLKHGDVEKVK